MSDHVATFAAEAPRLTSLAYRMLGTPDDADDVVQDTWLRWDSADRDAIAVPAAWLTTVTTRVAIDRLRSARARREVYVGPWLPEPVPTGDDDPLLVAADADSLSLAFLTLLERLDPVERAVLLLHDVFGYPFTEVASMVERSEPATRKLASRARARVRDDAPRAGATGDDARRSDADPTVARALAQAFLGAVVLGDVEGLRSMLTDDVVHLSDGGAHRRAARRPVRGPDRVGRLLVNLARRADPDLAVHEVMVNGQAGWYVTVGDRPEMVLVPTIVAGRVARVHAVLEPTKLAGFDRRWRATRPS